MAEELRVRRARSEDVPALTELLHLPAADMYDRMAGSHARALRVIAADLAGGSLDAVWVAELGGEPAGAMVAQRFGGEPARARRHLRLLLRHTPPWRWPVIAWMHWRGQRLAPSHPEDWLYVDALATDPAYRRRGVASALLVRAEEIAAERGAPAIALDTSHGNQSALALYRRAGFRIIGEVPARRPIPAVVLLSKDVA
ncbi:MAG: hypothetical protein QOI65_331 [Thermoleophilaceae bacterium]|nr:hypothetical protein [Thermoleophilaceae bacterium]